MTSLSLAIAFGTRLLLVLLFLPFSALDKILNFKGAVGQARQAVHATAPAVALILMMLMVTLDVAGVPSFAPLICYEIIFPGFTPDGQNRPSWILNVSNDAWFGPTPGPWQHLAQARYRAIEEGLPVIRAASGGVSGVIDARGRQLAAMPPYSSDYLNIQIPDPGKATLYSRFNFLGVLTLVVVALGALALLARSGLTPAKTRVDNKKTSY